MFLVLWPQFLSVLVVFFFFLSHKILNLHVPCSPHFFPDSDVLLFAIWIYFGDTRSIWTPVRHHQNRMIAQLTVLPPKYLHSQERCRGRLQWLMWWGSVRWGLCAVIKQYSQWFFIVILLNRNLYLNYLRLLFIHEVVLFVYSLTLAALRSVYLDLKITTSHLISDDHLSCRMPEVRGPPQLNHGSISHHLASAQGSSWTRWIDRSPRNHHAFVTYESGRSRQRSLVWVSFISPRQTSVRVELGSSAGYKLLHVQHHISCHSQQAPLDSNQEKNWLQDRPYGPSLLSWWCAGIPDGTVPSCWLNRRSTMSPSAFRGDLVVPRFRLQTFGHRVFLSQAPKFGTLFRSRLDNRVTIDCSSNRNWNLFQMFWALLWIHI